MTLRNFPRAKKNGKKSLSPKKTFVSKNLKTSKTSEKPKKSKVLRNHEANNLTRESLVDGMVVLGTVHEITKYEIFVSLPGHMRGNVKITDLSKSYTKLLTKITENASNENSICEQIEHLTELYQKGDRVVCYVNAQSADKQYLSLSMEPNKINSYLNPLLMTKGSVFACTVESEEDHGYIMETGMRNVRAFMAKKEGSTNYMGKQILCTIKSFSIENNICTFQLKKTKKSVFQKEDEQPLNNIVPGSKFTLSVKAIVKNGVEVVFNTENTGFINQLHLTKLPTKYTEGEEITGTLLYVFPISKFAFFTELGAEEKRHLEKGDIIEKAKVIGFDRNCVLLKFSKGKSRALVPYNKTDVAFHKIHKVLEPGTTKKVRVISYESMDNVHVCSMEEKVLCDKYMTERDLEPGKLVEVKVEAVKEYGELKVSFEKLYGVVPKEHIDNEECEKVPKVGDVVSARVFSYWKEKNRLIFTLRKDFVKSKGPVLTNVEDIDVGRAYPGLIVSITKDRGIGVKFFNNIWGVVQKSKKNKEKGKRCKIGQVLNFLVNGVEGYRLTLSFVEPAEIGKQVEGVVLESGLTGLTVQLTKSSEIGFLPSTHLSPCVEIGSVLANNTTPGTTLLCHVFATFPKLLLSTWCFPEKPLHLDQLEKGSLVTCSVHGVDTSGHLKVIVPVEKQNKIVHVSDYKGPVYKRMESDLSTHQILIGKIETFDDDNRIDTISLRHAFPSATELQKTAQVDCLEMYMKSVRELSLLPENETLASVKLGYQLNGKVKSISELGLVLELENNMTGTVVKGHYKDDVKVGDSVTGVVLWVNFIYKTVEMSILPLIVNRVRAKQGNLLKETEEGTPLTGKVVLITNWFVLLLLKPKFKGILVALPVRRSLNDLVPDLSDFKMFKMMDCYGVFSAGENGLQLPICMSKNILLKTPKVRKAKSDKFPKTKVGKKEDEDENQKVEDEDKDEQVEDEDEKVEEESEVDEVESDVEEKTKSNRKRKRSRKGKKEAVALKEEVSKKTKRKVEVKNEPMEKDDNEMKIPANLGFYSDPTLFKTVDTSSSDDSSDAEDAAPKKKKKLTAAERREMERTKEREIRAREEALYSSGVPDSVEKFNRLVISSPNSSVVWIQYMAFYLQTLDVEKARSVAQRAVSEIAYRMEDERLNVWQAWLNLESSFGTADSLESVFNEALRVNDEEKIYLHMMKIHVETDKKWELEKLANKVVKKFNKNLEMWVQAGEALLQVGLKEKARFLMQRALQSLPDTQHINIMVKFAELENKFGEKERAQTLFEEILSSYPKKTEVWNAYTQALISSGDVDVARRVFERAIAMPMPPKKIKEIFKAYLEFEKNQGPENIETVQKKALEYLKNNC